MSLVQNLTSRNESCHFNFKQDFISDFSKTTQDENKNIFSGLSLHKPVPVNKSALKAVLTPNNKQD
jgi:hypothetical protein